MLKTEQKYLMNFCLNSDPMKFFDHAKKYIEYLKKQLDTQSTTTSEQNNPYRIQIAELCRDIIEEKRLELSHDDEKFYRLLSIDMLIIVKTISTNLNEFVSGKKKEIIFLHIFFYSLF
jgi:hypothetical protein